MITAINNPTPSDLIKAYNEFVSFGSIGWISEQMQDERSFVRSLLFNCDKFLPIIVCSDGNPMALIWFTNYSADNFISIHFCASSRLEPIGVLKRSHQVIDEILANSDLNVMFATYSLDNPNACRMAKRFGFDEFSRFNNIVYSAKTKQHKEFYHGKTARNAKANFVARSDNN